MTGSLILTGAARIVERFDDPARDRGGDLVIRRGQVAPTASAPSPDESIDTLDADGGIVTPGLVNAHHHLLQSGFRTLPGTRGVPMREWLPAMAAAYESPEQVADGIAALTALGVGVHSPHQWNVDFRLPETVALARSTDPRGLLNPGKLNPDYAGPVKGSIR